VVLTTTGSITYTIRAPEKVKAEKSLSVQSHGKVLALESLGTGSSNTWLFADSSSTPGKERMTPESPWGVDLERPEGCEVGCGQICERTGKLSNRFDEMPGELVGEDSDTELITKTGSIFTCKERCHTGKLLRPHYNNYADSARVKHAGSTLCLASTLHDESALCGKRGCGLNDLP
jgi:hypothetical protein